MSILAYHHMIPRSFGGHDAFDGIDKRTLGVESFANGIYLPVDYRLAKDMGISPHPGGHTELYYGAVKCALDRIAKIPEPDIRAVKIKALMDAMRIGFAKGDLYTNLPIGGTLEEVQHGIKKVITNNEGYISDNPDSHRDVRDREQRGLETGHDHLPLWSAILGHARREELLDKAVKQDPQHITARNRHLGGTQYSKFTPVDDIFHIPPSTPANPADAPLPPPFFPPFLQWLNEPEGFTRNDPRFAGGPPPSQAPSPNEQRLGQLPPSTAVPLPPQVLQFNNETGDLFKFSDGSPMMGPDPYNLPHDPADAPAILRGMALFGAAMAVPVLWPFLPALAPIVGLGLAGATAARAEPTGNMKDGLSAAETSPNARFDPNDNVASDGDRSPGSRPATSEAGGKPFEQGSTDTGTFVDRFGNWIDAPGGTMPDQDVQVPTAPAAGAAAPEELRRLTRVNASNAGSVFTSGSAPIPYLPSTEFNDRFGHWTTPTAYGQPPQTGRPTGTFADEPGYIVPPPIFGTDDPGDARNGAEQWFSRWIGPLLRS